MYVNKSRFLMFTFSPFHSSPFHLCSFTFSPLRQFIFHYNNLSWPNIIHSQGSFHVFMLPLLVLLIMSSSFGVRKLFLHFRVAARYKEQPQAMSFRCLKVLSRQYQLRGSLHFSMWTFHATPSLSEYKEEFHRKNSHWTCYLHSPRQPDAEFQVQNVGSIGAGVGKV